MYKIVTSLAYLFCLSHSLAFPAHDQVTLLETTHSKVSSALDHVDSVLIGKQDTTRNIKTFAMGKTDREELKDKCSNDEPKKNPFSLTVNWLPGDRTWKYLSETDASRSGITRYRLYQAEAGADFDYELDFSNTDDYDYWFWDRAGDGHEANTRRTGDQKYGLVSRDPVIVLIEGK